MERHLQLDTQITSHLLAALNLPPIRDVPSISHGSHDQRRDRPLPLEPSASNPPSSFPLNSSNPNCVGPGSIDSLLSTGDVSSSRDVELPAKEPPALTSRPESTTQTASSEPTVVGFPVPIPPISGSTNAAGASTSKASTLKPSGNTRRRKTVDPNRKVRRKWSEQETNDLIRGCHIHGVGNWKNILNDSQFQFDGRSSVDLKDRFRTCFPKEYRRGQAAKKAAEATNKKNAADADASHDAKVTKTELQHAEMVQKLGLAGTEFPKAVRKERTSFTPEEDKRLLEGFHIYGPVWSRIQTDPTLNLGHRRSTDLRDRFRNAFPDRYESAGFKARSRHQLRRSATIPPNETRPTNPPKAEPQRRQPLLSSAGESSKETTPSLLIQGVIDPVLSSGWQTQDDEDEEEEEEEEEDTEVESGSDQSPVPGSLALDPALTQGFRESSLEQITEKFLSEPDLNQPRNHSIVRWEDMATHPIFELEPALTTDPPHHPAPVLMVDKGVQNVQKRPAEQGEYEGTAKRVCT